MSYDSQTSTSLINKLRKDVDSLTLKVAVLTDSKPSGTSGGNGVATTWTTRELNTIASDPNSLIQALTSNSFTLAAGAYQIRTMASFLHTGHTRMRIYDVTGSAETSTDVVIGYSVSVEVSNQSNTYNDINVRVQPHKNTVYRLEYYISAAGADHLGIAAGLTSIPETYAVCEITRLDTGLTKPSGGSGIQGAPGPAGPAGPPGPVGPSGSGTVTLVSVVTASGVSGVVANDTTTPAITLTLGAITPTSVAATGAISSLATVTGSNLVGVNTGDQTISLTGDVTGTGTGSFAATIANSAVTLSKLATLSTYSRLLGSTPSGTSVSELILGTNLSITGNTLNAAGCGGTVTSTSVTTANGVSGTVANPTTTPAITIALGAITPSSVTSTGALSGTNLSGTNTGDQTISLTGDVTGTGTGSFAATIANSAVTLAKLATLSANSRLLGSTPSGTSVSELIVGTNLSITGNTLNATSTGGTVTSASVTTANGVSGTVANPTTTPAISLTLGAITPSSVASTGALSGTNLSGTNTGDQTIALTGDVTGTGTGSFAATIANSAVTLAKLATLSANSRLLGSTPSGTSVSELIVGTNLSITGNTLNASGSGSGTVTSTSVTTANGVSGTVANPTTTPAITLTLGAITPSSVAATGTVTGSNLSGTNTGTQTISLTGDVTGTGTGSFAATIANSAVTLSKLATLSTYSRLLGSTPSGTSVSELILGTNLSITGNTLNATGTGGGTVTSTSVTTANGVSGTVANPTTTPAITIALGAITPSSVAATGTVTGSNLSGTNTGNQTITLTGDVTGSGTGSFSATIGSNTVTYAKMQSASGFSRIVGSNASSFALTELSLGTNLSMTGSVINATGSGTGDVVGPASSNDGYLALYDGLTGKLIKQGVWKDQGDDLIGLAGASSMTHGFVYIPTDTLKPTGSPINNTPGSKNSPMYFRSNATGIYELWIHDGATWRGVDLPLT